MEIIRTQNLTFKYSKKTATILKNLSLKIKAGTINILIGLNGSGKTTLIKLLAGLIPAKTGCVLLKEQNIQKVSIQNRAKIISYVSQKNNFVDDFLVKDYLLLSTVNQLKFYQQPDSVLLLNVIEQAKRFGIEKHLDKKLGQISGGERQIVSICGAVLQNTEIIILDEPTSALDIKNQHLVLSVLKELSSRENKTIIMSSHNPNHALYLDSNVFLLKNGNVLKQGNADAVIKIEILKEIYGDDICLSKELLYDEITFKK